ncbi:glutathione peroxidase [Pelagibacteraceae bacterium]|jgi:glutathione peroxidase|nr:glutathione peroxidase [Pelagibacteraceae bacterium]|tara:strand:+ start:831 stop:1295 length:465 start_codon:yes stop_codon:yes gene_type:complete
MKSIYDFSVKDIDHEEISLEKFKGKTLLIVNVASRCGFTSQYTGLQSLYEKYKDKGFEILAFPCNQFGSQEKGTNDEIKEFCSTEYNVSFKLFDKIEVIGDNASPLFKKLTQDAGREIQWNFTKYLINKDGDFVRGFGTQKKPEEIEEHIVKIL